MEPKLSPVYGRCLKVYNEMLSRAEANDDYDEMVYVGHLTDVFKAAKIPYQPYYSEVMRYLQKFNSIEKVARGAGRKYSVWLVHNAPEKENFMDLKNRRTVKYEKLIENLDTRLKKVEAIIYGYGVEDPR